MSETETTPILLSAADSWRAGDKLTFQMDEGLTVMQVHVAGEQPAVDILETAEGRTSGPLMRFIGSVANREALQEGGIVPGAVIRSYKLAVAADAGRPYLLTGRVDTLQLRHGRTPKPKE